MIGDILHLAALAALAAWLWMLFFRGGFWKADCLLHDDDNAPADWPDVVAVIPARDEAPSIGRAVASLLGQDYPGDFSLIVVDDASSDGTAEAARDAAREAGAEDRFEIVAGAALPAGWTGKLWAVHQGLERAAVTYPGAAYALLTDADIEHDPTSLRRLVAKAEADGLDLVSLMVRLNCTHFWERLLIPAFVFFFQKLYPFPWVNDSSRREAAAAGGCMLVRRRALDQAGGIARIRGAVIDDCALAALLKGNGPIWLGLSARVVSLRAYGGLGEIWRMVARSAYTQLDHSPLALLGAVLGMTVLYLAPPLALIFGPGGSAWLVGLAAWMVMGIAYGPTLRLYGQSAWDGLLLPVAAFFYTLMTVSSAIAHWRGMGGAWKGRSYGPGRWCIDSPMNKPGPDIDDGGAAAAHVEAIVRKSRTSFYWAMRLLDGDRRRAMYAIYAFCRLVDDVADDEGAPDDKRRGLQAWRREIAALYAGGPSHPVTRALAGPLAAYGLKQRDFLAVIDGMEMDAGVGLRFEDMATLELYCDRVAGAVGRLSNRVFGIDDARGDVIASALGQALQLTNILRDLDEDAARDRLYLPCDMLRRHGIDPGDAVAVLGHPRLGEVAGELAVIAKDRFAVADAALSRCDRRQMRAAVIMMEVYRRIFERLLARGWHRHGEAVGLTRLEKIWIMLRHGVFV